MSNRGCVCSCSERKPPEPRVEPAPVSEFGRVVHNAGWNLLGNLLPLCAAVVAIPFLLGRMGTERFGLLSLTWVLVGYFSLFDLGLGRALTRMVAERNVPGNEGQLSTLCSTGLALVGVLGLVGGLLVAMAIPLSRPWIDRLPAELRGETGRALILIALGIPLVVATAALQGIMEGFQRFRLLNTVRVPAGIALFLAPCASAWYSPQLDWAVVALLVTRVMVLGAYFLPCIRLVRLTAAAVQRRWILPMLRFGGWLTVSNIIGPVIVYVDRFVIGALLSTAALTYYSVPFDVISRMLLFPVALTGALFPALSQMQSQNLVAARQLRRRSLELTLAVVLPLAGLGALLAEPVLRFWLGGEFPAQSTRVMQILLVGFIFNAVANVPFTALQGHGSTRQTALLHLVELPFYLVTLVVLVNNRQLEGAAIAWALRALVDWVALSWLLRIEERKLSIADARAAIDG